MNKNFNPLSQGQITELNQAISEAEKTTSAEIIPVLVKEVPKGKIKACLTLISLLQVLSISLFLATGYLAFHKGVNLKYLLPVAVLFFLGVVIAKLMIWSHRQIHDLVVKEAVKEFEVQGIGQTMFANGVLIFVSLKDRRVVILADKTIKDQVSDSTWNEIILRFQVKVKKSLPLALKAMIKEVGETCSRVCPKTNNDLNEIKNEIIIKG